ncbi:MAG: hypothetical protein RSP_15700 [Rhodanobacter sp.]
MSVLLNLDRPIEWPDALKATLDNVRPIMRAWELGLPAKNGADFDRGVVTLGNALLSYSVRGWHCTRLTDDEAANIEAVGLAPLSADLIERRITTQVRRGTLPVAVGDILRAAHQGAASNRAGMIWFCFFPPYEAGEGGIHRLLRHWGGEAMYWAHESDATVAPVLRQLGMPCIVEADVPVAWLSDTYSVAMSVARRDLIHHGESVTEPVRFEAHATCAIPGDCVHAVHRFPGARFIALSGCDGWRAPLS